MWGLIKPELTRHCLALSLPLLHDHSLLVLRLAAFSRVLKHYKEGSFVNVYNLASTSCFQGPVRGISCHSALPWISQFHLPFRWEARLVNAWLGYGRHQPGLSDGLRTDTKSPNTHPKNPDEWGQWSNATPSGKFRIKQFEKLTKQIVFMWSDGEEVDVQSLLLLIVDYCFKHFH